MCTRPGFIQRDFFSMGPSAKTGDASADNMASTVKDDTADRRVYPRQALIEPGEGVGPSHHATVATT